MRPLFVSKNLVSHDIIEGCPWNFDVTPERVHEMQNLSREVRRSTLFQPTFQWNTYNGLCGSVTQNRVSADNPPILCRALVVDYDAKTSPEMVYDYVSKLDPSIQPNFLEQSLGGNWRALWIFEKDILTDGLNFAQEYLKVLIKTLGADKMLAGYDEASWKATQMWTNGGYWLENHDKPLSYNFLIGAACTLISERKSEGFEIPIEIIATEVERRFPGRWQGTFEIGGHGVRFWDSKADNPRGAFITKHGCYCFTGLKAYVSWEEIFGKTWVDTNRNINLGEITKNIFTDGKSYWYESSMGQYLSKGREDILLSFRVKGLSNKISKGATSSDADKALEHVNTYSRVSGGAPLLYRPPGVNLVNGHKILNTSFTPLIVPSAGPCEPSQIPELWDWFQGLFVKLQGTTPELYWISHWANVVQGIYVGKPVTGRAVFLCGPPESGKTMLCERILSPLLGGKMADPNAYMMGLTPFNADLLNAGLLAINDSEAPTGDKERNQWAQRMKSMVVNDVFQYHAKFKEKIEITYPGKIIVTLNTDPKSLSMLLGLEEGTKDKVMFFAVKERVGGWPNKYDMRATIDKGLPVLVRILLDWKIPDFIIDERSRYGLKSYYDPTLVELSHQQESSYNLQEIIMVWQKEGFYWVENDENRCWEGTATELLAELSEQTSLHVVLKDWNGYRIAKALTSLSSLSSSGVSSIGGTKSRKYKICKI